MMKIFRKLIRDNMPVIMEAQGKHLKTRILNDEEFLPALENKLLEETQELRTDPAESKPAKIAYIYEILDYIVRATGSTPEQIETIRKEDFVKKGGFDKKLFLEGEGE